MCKCHFLPHYKRLGTISIHNFALGLSLPLLLTSSQSCVPKYLPTYWNPLSRILKQGLFCRVHPAARHTVQHHFEQSVEHTLSISGPRHTLSLPKVIFIRTLFLLHTKIHWTHHIKGNLYYGVSARDLYQPGKKTTIGCSA
jgi:hypothetical protein